MHYYSKSTLVLFIGLIATSACSSPEVIPLVQEFRFPAPDNENPEYLLATPSDFTFIGDDTFAVSDWLAHQIWILGCDGSLITTFGRQGHGPGELYFPDEVSYDKGTSQLWVKDRTRFQAFRITDWQYVDGFRRGPNLEYHAVTRNDTFYTISNRDDAENIVYTINSNGELLYTLGDYLPREVSQEGVGLHKNGVFDFEVLPNGTTFGCFAYHSFNDVIILRGESQEIIHVKHSSIRKQDRLNKKWALNWPDPNDNSRPSPSILFTQLVLFGDRIFIQPEKYFFEGIIEISHSGEIIAVYDYESPGERVRTPRRFLVSTEDDHLVFWMLWYSPGPHISKLVPAI